MTLDFRNTISSFEGPYSFLSNFHPSPIIFMDKWYKTVEHAYQAHKTTDLELREKIRSLESPAEAKKEAKKLKLRYNWENLKLPLMTVLVFKKFESNLSLREQLLLTGDNILIEGNLRHDNFWGDCVCLKCRLTEGKNNLGLILMDVRSLLSKREL